MILKAGWKNGKFEPSSITLLGKTTEKKEKETGTIPPSLNTPHPKARIQNIQKILRSNSTVATLLAAKRMTQAFPDCLRSKSHQTTSTNSSMDDDDISSFSELSSQPTSGFDSNQSVVTSPSYSFQNVTSGVEDDTESVSWF